MRKFILVSASLLCSLFWMVGSESHTLEVQPGEDVTLLCSNFTSSPTQITWFKLVIRREFPCVAHMLQYGEPARLCSGFQKGKFEMTSNNSTVFLHIKEVDSSDSGLYFCGYKVGRNPVIVDATFLEVQDDLDGMTKLMLLILAGLAVVLVMIIICLAVKIRQLQKAQNEEKNPQQNEGPGSDDLNYAAVTFHPRAERNHRQASDREVEPDCIYSATRQTKSNCN
ncbi:uncharacterized protein LOC121504927 [Cheilinus undulatus]|uniref:uncharacterized protein LOC121504927 n=1 Tax=Cheilinus undulatus TaxID=241271 RepID=UPI001BD39876|nr:uncharacterized protein LOC121504927 [Cheilinus undulatus]